MHIRNQDLIIIVFNGGGGLGGRGVGGSYLQQTASETFVVLCFGAGK